MPAFTITTPTSAILLDEDRRGAAGFTVTNETGRSLRARASVSPFEPAPGDWFRLEGEAERLMSPGASESYLVRIAVPAGTGTGPRSFRLDVASVDRPDEEWAHGPAVGFDLTGPGLLVPGYIETVVGVLIGSFGGILLAAIASIPAWLATGLPDFNPGLIIQTLFVPIFAGDLVVGVALGGAIGIFGALTLKTILLPTPWRTAVVYIAIAFVLATILQVLLAVTMPVRFDTQPSVLRDVLAIVLAFVAAALAGLGARAFTRWQVVGSI